MKKEILKRIVFALMVAVLTSISYSWAKLDAAINRDDGQLVLIVAILSFLFCIVNFVLSLTAFFNVLPSIRQSFLKSLLAFMLLPVLLLIIFLTKFITRNESPGPNTELRDFLMIWVPSLVYCLVLTFQFYLFRRKIRSEEK